MKKIERNYGVDLLRIVAMYMVVVLHVLGKGGILYSLPKLSLSYEVAWILEIAAYCAVNCYALISGYVGVNSRFKISSIITLWLQVAFYTLGITVLFNCFMGETITTTHFLRALFPAIFKQYWYFSAYVILFFMTPFINAGIQGMKKTDLKIIILIMTVLFSFVSTFISSDYFMLNDGYSALWLIYLYIVGGYIKKYGLCDCLSKSKLLLMYVISVLMTYLSKFAFEHFALNIVESSRLFVNYLSPTILLAAISLLLLFSKIEVKGIVKKIVLILSPATFGVYLIHTQPLVWKYIWTNLFHSYISFSPLKLAIMVVITAAVVYVLLSIIDMMRNKIFNLLKVRENVIKIENCFIETLSDKNI